MKYYEVTTMRNYCGDEWTSYKGTNFEKAKQSFKDEKDYLKCNKNDLIELREYEVPENWNELDEDEKENIICYSVGYDLIDEAQGEEYNANTRL